MTGNSESNEKTKPLDFNPCYNGANLCFYKNLTEQKKYNFH